MKKKNNKGFSLIELIIAIAILVILTGLLAPQFMRYMEKSREAKDMQALDTIYGATQAALADEAAYKEVLALTGGTGGTGGDTLYPMKDKGITLTAILGENGAFTKEFKATLGGNFEESKPLTGWSSAAINTLGGSDEVYIMVEEETLQVFVWAGEEATTAGVLDDSNILGGTDAALGKTAGAVFVINKPAPEPTEAP